jgi:sec-independent protein translocase protein TatB
MFDFSWSEILLIGIVALVFIGPKELPGVLRTLGQWMAKVRRMASEFQNQFHDAMREAELADLKKEVDDMASQASRYANFDPLAEARSEMDKAQREVESALAGTPAGEAKPTSDPAPAAATPPEGEAGTAAAASQPPSEAAPAEGPAAREGVSVAPTDEPKAEAEHAKAGAEHATGGSERG